MKRAEAERQAELARIALAEVDAMPVSEAVRHPPADGGWVHHSSSLRFGTATRARALAELRMYGPEYPTRCAPCARQVAGLVRQGQSPELVPRCLTVGEVLLGHRCGKVWT